jgi:hypothetical protein
MRDRPANAGNGTNDATSAESAVAARQPAMTGEEREAIRKAGADDARRSRTKHGFPERIEDPAAVARLAALLRDIPAPRQPSESTSDERNPAAYARGAVETITMIRLRRSFALVAVKPPYGPRGSVMHSLEKRNRVGSCHRCRYGPG